MDPTKPHGISSGIAWLVVLCTAAAWHRVRMRERCLRLIDHLPMLVAPDAEMAELVVFDEQSKGASR